MASSDQKKDLLKRMWPVIGEQPDNEKPRKAADELTSSSLKGGLRDSKWMDQEYKPGQNRRTYMQDLNEERVKLLRLE